MPSNQTKTMQVTIPYALFNKMVIEMELDNQDELDNYIQSLITESLDKLFENASIAEHLRHPILEFEQWLDKYSDDLDIETSESGADRKLDFDFETFTEKRYEDYLKYHGEY